MSGFNANLLLAGINNSPWLSTDELQAPAKLAMAQQRNALLNRMDEQNLQAQDMEMIARASAYLETLPDTAARQAAYPGLVSQLQQSGFAKNAPSVYPGDERISQLARMGTPSKELLTLSENRRFAQSQNTGTGAGTGTTAAPGGATTTTSTAPGSYEGAIGGHEGTGQNPRSTAFGTGQFLESTWLQFAAANPEMFPNMSQQQILAARSNPALGNTAINWLAQKNAADLQTAGVAPSGQSLGIAHYLGSGAAGRIMQAGDAEPVRNFVSEAAVRANPELANMTVGQMKARYAGTPNPSFMTATTTPPGGQRVQVASVTPTTMTDGTTARPTGGSGGAVATDGTTTTIPAQQPPAATTAAVPGMLALGNDGLTDQQRADNARLFATGTMSPKEQIALRQQQQQQNLARNHELATDRRQAAADAATAAERQYQHDKDKAAALRQARLDEAAAKKAEQDAANAVVENNKKQAELANITFNQENTLRDEFQKLTGDFRIVQTSYENIRSAAKANDGAGDMSLLYNYVRLLDPTSVVRESEFAAAAASGSFGERVQGAVQRVLSGARMPESLRESFIREGRNLYDNQLRSHNDIADKYETLAKRNGLEPGRVVTRFNRPQGEEVATPPASLLKEGVVTEFANGQRWTLKGGQPAQVK